MRIISVRPAPVARVFALTYAACGLAAFIQYAFSSMQTFILPIGILIGVFHLNVNIHLGRSSDLLANALLCIGAILSFALSGWITGVALTLCFNFIAEKTGGVDAKFVTVAEDSAASPAKVLAG
jgi:hypothetical protein